MALTEEQLALRRTKITATDAAKVCGVSNYGGPLDVQLEKQGRGVVIDENDRMRWGNILEGPIREDFAQRMDVAIAVPGTLIHPEHDWAAATPDGIVYPGGTPLAHGTAFSYGPENVNPIGGHEIKTHTSWLAHLYGEPGSDEVPPAELVQCAWNRWIAAAVFEGGDFSTWHLTAFLDNLPSDYQIHHNAELEEMMIGVCRAFWEEHVIGGVPVPPDGSKSYTEHLAKRWPKHGQDYVEADAETLETVRALYQKRLEIAAHEREETELVQRIKVAIGDAAGLEFLSLTEKQPEPKGKRKRKPLLQRITWKKSKDTTSTKWADVIKAFRPQLAAFADQFEDARELLEALDAAITSHTSPKPGSRRFNVPKKWNS